MNLDEAQRHQVADWIAAGAKLSEIQNRLLSEFGAKFTYMEVRFLVDDLKLTPKDPEPPKVVAPPAAEAPAAGAVPAPGEEPLAAGGVAVTVDHLTKPGTMISGKVVFSDVQQADWYLDQTGRLGVVPKVAGYKPSAADVQEFQAALQREIAKLGF